MQTTSLNPREAAALAPGSSSAVAWSAIFGGAIAALALSFTLIVLGSGLGFASLSPFTRNPSAVTVTSAVVSWLIVTQWISAGLGGYLAGRLRTRYVSIHTDEMFFRDTAHGFLSWAVASIVTALIFASSAFSGISGGAHAAAMAAHEAPKPGMDMPGQPPMNGPDAGNMYVVDGLFRSSAPTAVGADDMQVRGETMLILMNGLKNGDVPTSDRAYLAQVVAAHANIPPAEATKRVDDAVAQMQQAREKAKEAADTARKTAATLAIFTFLSLIIGAFIASVTGALGGKRRDEYAL